MFLSNTQQLEDYAVAQPPYTVIKKGVVITALAIGKGSSAYCVGPPLYTARVNLNRKVLDFVQFGGPERTELRTFRWEVPL